MELTAEQRELIKKRQIANALAKINSGKSVTAREQRLIDELTGESEAFTRSWDSLAKLLGVNRRTIQKWRERFKAAKDLPQEKSDGRKNIHEWRQFMARHNLGGDAAALTSQESEEPNKAHWDKERSKVDFEMALFRLEIERKKYVELDEICAAVGQMLAGFRTAINMHPGSAARWLVGLKDFHAIKAKLESEVDTILRALGRCEYLVENLTPKIVDRLFADRPKQFRGEIITACHQVFVEIGRQSLSDLTQSDLTPIDSGPAATGTTAGVSEKK